MTSHFRPLRLPLTLLFAVFFLNAQSQNDYQSAWNALAKNDFKTARAYLKQAEKNPAIATDAQLTTMLLEPMEGNDELERGDFERAKKNLDNCNPYYFALWRNEGFAGEYGQKTQEQQKFLEQLVEDPKTEEGMNASARYHLHHHYISKQDLKKSNAITAPIAGVYHWQFTGPFDNVSESGFDKNYPPVTQARPDAKFQAQNNADIRWFTPGFIDQDGWVLAGNYIKWNTGLIYAQSFITVPSDMDLVLATGYTSSSLKIWVNDQLVFAEQEPHITDFDAFKVPCKLKKGANRILLQIGLMDDEHANFSVRFLGLDGKPVQNLASSATFQEYPKATGPIPARIPFFAVEYFKKKIEAQPDNLLNYYFLSSTYLRLLEKEKAIETIEKALVIAPDNLLLRFQRLLCLQKLSNRTALSQEAEDFKRLAPENLLSLALRFEEAMSNENLDEAMTILETWEKKFGTDVSTINKRIDLLLKKQNYQEAIQLIDESADKYPDQAYYANLQHNIALRVKKDPEGAISILNSYLRKNYMWPIISTIADDYISIGMGNKAVDLYKKSLDYFQGEPATMERLANYFYSINDFEKCKYWYEQLLSQAPFHSTYWENLARCVERTDDKKDALEYYQKALHYGPNNYDVRRQIRQLEGKADFSTLMPQYDAFDLYKKANDTGKAGEYDWYYILDEHCTILYPERNSEMVSTLIVKVLNQAGIDYWKESNIGYDEGTQTLIIEKAEVLKPNGSKIAAEQNGSQLVFPNLQVGDGINIRYRLANYAFGRMAREFTAPYFFDAFVPTEISRYCLLAPPSINLNFKNFNHNIQPKITELESGNLKQYLWESFNEPAIKDQRYMPNSYDVAKVLHISTIPDWSEIANWYGDVSGDQAKRDYDVQQLFKTLFPAGTNYTQTQKARMIYNWIGKNIRYSSVPFRQSGLVPQRAARVIQTKLGDCKDLATLFAALAREGGLEANLVLVNTRDQGTNAMVLPSMNFNHCIVKVIADGKTWYLELTMPELPFGGLPANDIKAFALEIPYGTNRPAQAKPFLLDPANRVPDFRTEQSKVEIKGRDISVETEAWRGGAIAGDKRGQYKDLSSAKRIEEMQGSLGGKFSNPLTVKELVFNDLTQPLDTLQYKVRYTVKNEVMEIGSLQTFKIPFFNLFIRADAFQEETRVHPFLFWSYEDTDRYLEKIEVNLQAGKSFSEVPKDVTLNYGDMKYSLTFKQTAPGTLQVTRDVTTVRDIIPADQYETFRTFTEAVVAAETRWVTFK